MLVLVLITNRKSWFHVSSGFQDGSQYSTDGLVNAHTILVYRSEIVVGVQVLPDVKPMLSDSDNNQAYPVAVVAQIPQELISVRQEDLEGDKDSQNKDKDKLDGNGKITFVSFSFSCFINLHTEDYCLS